MNKKLEELNKKSVEDIYNLLADVREGKLDDQDTILALFKIIKNELNNRFNCNVGFCLNVVKYKALGFLLYSEAEYFEEFNLSLNDGLKEAEEEKNVITYYRTSLGKMIRCKIFDAEALYLIYKSAVSIRALQERRESYLTQQLSLLENSMNYIKYCPSNLIELDRKLILELKGSVHKLENDKID